MRGAYRAPTSIETELKHADSHSVICTFVYLLANGVAKTRCSLHAAEAKQMSQLHRHQFDIVRERDAWSIHSPKQNPLVPQFDAIHLPSPSLDLQGQLEIALANSAGS